MTEPSLRLDEGRTRYQPGEQLSGVVSWALGQPPRSAELRLYWQTEGKGTRDVAVVERLALANPQAFERRAFDLKLPLLPHSFTGQLVSLSWGIEVVLQPGNLTCDQPIVVAPGGQALVLPARDNT